MPWGQRGGANKLLHYSIRLNLLSVSSDGGSIPKHVTDDQSLAEAPVIITDGSPGPIGEDLHCSFIVRGDTPIYNQSDRMNKVGSTWASWKRGK